jgi:hypothetical protein
MSTWYLPSNQSPPDSGELGSLPRTTTRCLLQFCTNSKYFCRLSKTGSRYLQGQSFSRRLVERKTKRSQDIIARCGENAGTTAGPGSLGGNGASRSWPCPTKFVCLTANGFQCTGCSFHQELQEGATNRRLRSAEVFTPGPSSSLSQSWHVTDLCF